MVDGAHQPRDEGGKRGKNTISYNDLQLFVLKNLITFCITHHVVLATCLYSSLFLANTLQQHGFDEDKGV